MHLTKFEKNGEITSYSTFNNFNLEAFFVSHENDYPIICLYPFIHYTLFFCFHYKENSGWKEETKIFRLEF